MYADRNARSGLNPASLSMAVLVNGGAATVLLLAQPIISIVDHNKPFIAYPVPPEPIPEPTQPPKPLDPKPLPRQHFDAPIPLDHPPIASDFPVPDNPPLPPLPLASSGSGEGNTGITAIPLPKPTPLAPVLVGPSIDQRYARDLQPPYPPEERRAGREGRVVVRVLVGVDGRVKDVQQVSTTSGAFLQATLDQARRKWRFKPATRDGVPIEAWRTMSLSFVLRDED